MLEEAGAAGTVVTVGSFDGVHLGHQAVLAEIVGRARATGRMAVLVTFEPHPLAVVRPERAPPLLTAPVERRGILAESGLDRVVVLRFDPRLATMPAERFVREILVAGCRVTELVVGDDHGFGQARGGDVALLRALGAELGFAVDVVPPVFVGPERVSSSAVRAAVQRGDLASARRLLGRPYRVSAQVVHGDARGRTLRVPTLNLGAIDPAKLLPPDGVYAVRVETRRGVVAGMMNQGARPTFGDGARSLEVHLLGAAGDWYGEWVRVEWVERLRDVMRFGSADELVAQLGRDRARAGQVLGLGGADVNP